MKTHICVKFLLLSSINEGVKQPDFTHLTIYLLKIPSSFR